MTNRRNSLLVTLTVTALVVTVALSWAGWRLLNQQRSIDQQRAQEQLGATAKSMAATLRSKLAETGERLSQAAANPMAPLPVLAGAGVLTFGADGALNAKGLPFVPRVQDTAAVDAVFHDAEVFEFANADLRAAANRYQALTSSTDPAVRAGALMRLARVAKKRGDAETALRTYARAGQLGNVRFGQVPVGFIALYQQREIAVGRGDAERERSLTATLQHGLDSGEWLLTRHVAANYRDELKLTTLPSSWRLADVVELVTHASGPLLGPRGQRVLTERGRSTLVMWRSSGSTTAMMAAFLDEFLPPAPPGVAWQLTNPAGDWLGGVRAMPARAIPPHVVGDSESPWMLHVAGLPGPVQSPRSERTVVAMLAAMLAFVWGAMYFMARAIRREAAVARLQSDFVAAVSHEFRTPLTTIRQMGEMLEGGRVTSQERRQEYYSVLTHEASRLQRLVETLLNFGRLEAGAAPYRFEETDIAALVQRVVQEIAPTQLSGRRIVTSGPGAGVIVHADANALTLAVRNLLDNALKYSPRMAPVHVEWDNANGRVAVRVIDSGIGIPSVEQRAIFNKFVRGRAAIEARVAGTGIGLAMVRQILRAHGGEVTVASEVDRGSTFTLVLPAASSHLSMHDARQEMTAQ